MAEEYDGTEGEAAEAAGLDVLDGTEDKRDGWLAINKTRDYIVQRIASAVATLNTALAGKAPTVHTHTPNQIGHGDLDVGPTGHVLAGGGFNSFGARNTPITNGPAPAMIASDGVFGIEASSMRFKRDPKPWAPPIDAVLALQLVAFYYIADGDDGPVQYGLIAEELHDAGFEWLVVYDDDDAPLSVRYDRLALALLPVIQDHEARLRTLEGKTT